MVDLYMPQYDKENIFAKIIKRTLPANIVYEDDFVIAFDDRYPDAKVHVLVLPKMDVVDYSDFINKSSPDQIGRFFERVQYVAEEKLGLKDSGYRILTNCGRDAKQFVFHFHIHILGGEPLDSTTHSYDAIEGGILENI